MLVKEKWPGGPRLTLSLLMAAGLINFLDRSSLSIALTSIRAEMHLTATQVGALASIFSLAYGFAQLPLGPLLDRVGAWRVLGFSLSTWSAAQLCTGLAQGFGAFVPLRVLLGIGEAPFFPGSVKLVRERFPLAMRGRAISGVNISTTLGQGLAPPLLTALMLWFGWRKMFVTLGVLGAALALAWFAVERRAAAGLPKLVEVLPRSGAWDDWLSFFRKRSMWGMMLGFGGVNYTSWFYIAWLPSYLQAARGVSVMRSGWLAALPFLAGSAGMYASGVLSDLRTGRGQQARSVLRSQIVVGMVVSALFTITLTRVVDVRVAVACISLALFWIHFAGTSAWGYVQASSRQSSVATVSSLQNFGSFLIASAAPIATGKLLDRTHSFGSAFALCAAVTLAGAACYVLLVFYGSSSQQQL